MNFIKNLFTPSFATLVGTLGLLEAKLRAHCAKMAAKSDDLEDRAAELQVQALAAANESLQAANMARRVAALVS